MDYQQDATANGSAPDSAKRVRRLQAYKFELYRPEGEQLQRILRFAEAARRVYNLALNFQIGRRQRGEKHLSAFGLGYYLAGWRASEPLYGAAPQKVLEAAIGDLDKAFKNFFAKRAGFPKLKPKHASPSFRMRGAIAIDQRNARIKLPKLGWLRYRGHREVLGTIKNATISQRCGKWFVSIQTEREIEAPVHPGGEPVGIDVGVTNFAALSDGSFVAPVGSFARHEKRLRKASQRLSRKVKFSNNWRKAKARLAKVHARIANVRRHFLHVHSCAIAKAHSLIAIEDLQITNMTASAAGTIEEPGRNVRAKTGLNRAILDQGWFEFRRQLDYKAEWNGGELIAVPPRNTSRECPACGHVAAENRTTQARFACVACGAVGHADTIGAINVLRRAVSVRIACQASPTGGRQQEPAEETPVPGDGIGISAGSRSFSGDTSTSCPQAVVASGQMVGGDNLDIGRQLKDEVVASGQMVGGDNEKLNVRGAGAVVVSGQMSGGDNCAG